MLLRSPGGSPYQSANRVVSRHPVDADVVHNRLDEAVGSTVARLEEQAHGLAGVGVERDRGQQPLRVALARRPARSPHLLAVDKQAQVVGCGERDVVEANLFDLTSERLLWAARSKTTKTGKVKEGVNDYTRTIIPELAKSGWIK